MTLRCLLVAAALAAPAAPGAVAASDPISPAGEALREGNARFREGDLEGALEIFAGAFDPGAPDPLLAYNLGATAHRLGHLPEAVVWYRRAELAGGADPWLRENLALARRELGLPAAAHGSGPAVWAAERRSAILLGAAALSWAALLALLARRGGIRRGGILLPAGLAALAVLLGGAAAATRLWGPRAAVLVAACGERAAGSEVWVRAAGRAGDEHRWRIAGRSGGDPCPAGAVELLLPGGRGAKN
jgi:hypothetical protein